MNLFHKKSAGIRSLALGLIALPAIGWLQGCVTPVVIDADEVGVKLNTLTGEATYLPNSGTYMQKWYIEQIHPVPKAEQNLEMTATANKGDALGRDNIRVKTCDGSDVDLDISITFKIDPTKAVEILRFTGEGANIKDVWIRPYSRCRLREELGRLSTEQMYDARQRQAKAESAKDRLNRDLNPYGFIILDINIQDFRFYEKYAAKIREKKSADQSVDKHKSERKAAIEDQKRQLVEAQKKVEVQIAQYQGNMKQEFLKAEATAKEKELGAKQFDIQKRIEGDTKLYQANNEAQQILALGKAKCESLKLQIGAMKGEGGLNLIRLKYAEKMAHLLVSGEPWLYLPEINSLQHRQGVAPPPNSGRGPNVSTPPANATGEDN